jgi:hypothetical protein
MPSLRHFLNERRVKDATWNLTGMGQDAGKYSVSNTEYDDFLQLHHDHVFVQNERSSLLEKHGEYTPILIDLDFRYSSDTNDRQFTKEDVRVFVKAYADAFFRFIEYSESIRFFVEVKPAPSIEKGVKKDGIHIICPDITVDYTIPFTLRKYVLEQNALACFSGHTNPAADCFDECVIKRNNWFLHGASKPDKDRYDVVYCFIADPDGGFDETEWDESNCDMSRLFSIRHNRELPSSVSIRTDMKDEWNMWESMVDKKPTRNIVSKDETASIASHISAGISKLLNFNGCTWDIVGHAEGYKLTHNSKVCLVESGYTHSDINHSCIFVQRSHATMTCLSHNSKRIPKIRSEKLWNLVTGEEEDTSEVYVRKKMTFEESSFRILDPPGYMVLIGGKWVHYSRQQLLDMNSGIFLDDARKVRFIDEWLRDETIRTYDRVGYYVNASECPDRIFNTFTGFVASNATSTDGDISAILRHIDILCNHSVCDREFVLDWLGQLVQCPDKLPGICLVINGQHGCGKDIFLSWFGTQIIGVENYFKTARPHIDLFGSFNSSRKNVVFYHIEEGNAVMLNETNVEQFKNYITDEYASIQLKQKDNNSLVRNYNHCVISTNSSSPFKIEPTERRFFGIQASNEACRNTEYFLQLSNAMADPGVAVGFYNFLMNREICGRDWKNPPRTEYMKRMIAASLPDVYHFMNDYLDTLEDEDVSTIIKASALYELYRDWCSTNGERKINNLSNFGNTLLPIIGIQKFRKTSGWNYTIEKAKVVTYLSQYI